MPAKFLLLPALFACGLSAAQVELNIYFVDVEGGGGTLIVGPSGESLLIDTGIPGAGGRDSKANQGPVYRA